ncbi:MAG: T9SS type A sorting domain-containing protein [Bacteroidota bacterium]
MKNKLLRLIIFLLIGYSTAFAQDCNIGNEDSSVFDNTGDPFFKDFLLGVSFDLSEVGTLSSLNLIGRNTGSSVQMAVYDDLNGVPNNLIVESDIGTVVEGIVSLPVENTVLQPGDYWVMAVYESDGGHCYNTNNAPGNVVYFDSLIFGDPIPSNASAFQTYTGTDMAYFLEIDCGVLGVGNQKIEDIVMYPNPATSELNFHSNGFFESVEIFTMHGQSILVSRNKTIDVSHLSVGTYLVNIRTQSGFNRSKFIKI